MNIFLSNTINKIDAKGRVSIPSQFRSVLENQGFAGVYLYPSFTSQSIDGGGESLINQIAQSIEKMQLFAEETDAFATALFSLPIFPRLHKQVSWSCNSLFFQFDFVVKSMKFEIFVDMSSRTSAHSFPRS